MKTNLDMVPCQDGDIHIQFALTWHVKTRRVTLRAKGSPGCYLLYMLRKWWGGVGMMTYLALAHMWHATDLTFLALARMSHVTCYGLEVSCMCTHVTVTCYASDGEGWGGGVSFTCTHVTCYGLDVSCTCTHVTCYGLAHMWHATESFLRFAFATRMLPKTFVESLRRHNDQAWTRKKADSQHRRNRQKCQNHKYHCLFLDTPWFWLTKRMVSSLSNNVQEFIDIKMLKNGDFHHHEYIQTRKIMKMMLYLREHIWNMFARKGHLY